jgi:hypothetical protein
MNIIITDNSHRKDYWSRERLQTWLIVEDNGTEDGGKILAEFRDKKHAESFTAAMRWTCRY